MRFTCAAQAPVQDCVMQLPGGAVGGVWDSSSASDENKSMDESNALSCPQEQAVGISPDLPT